MVKIDNVYIKKARRKRMIKRIIILSIFLAICCIIFITKTNFFNIKEIQITGNHILTGEDIKLNTQDLLDSNIILIKKSDIEKKIKRNPYIESIDIKRKLPGNLLIDVNERKGIYYINSGGKYNVISDELYLLEIIDDIAGKELVEVKGIDIDNVELGNKVEDNARINKILYYFYRMISLLKEKDEVIPIKSIDLTDLSRIKVYIGEIEVKLGNDEDIIRKMNDAINIYKSGVVESYIDVSFDGFPAYK